LQAQANVDDAATRKQRQGQQREAEAARETLEEDSHQKFSWRTPADHADCNGKVAGGGQQLHPLLHAFPGPLNSALQQQQQQKLEPSQPPLQWLQHQQLRPQPSLPQLQLHHSNIHVRVQPVWHLHHQMCQMHQFQRQSFGDSGLRHGLTLDMPVAQVSFPVNTPTTYTTQQTGAPTVTRVTLPFPF